MIAELRAILAPRGRRASPVPSDQGQVPSPPGNHENASRQAPSGQGHVSTTAPGAQSPPGPSPPLQSATDGLPDGKPLGGPIRASQTASTREPSAGAPVELETASTREPSAGATVELPAAPAATADPVAVAASDPAVTTPVDSTVHAGEENAPVDLNPPVDLGRLGWLVTMVACLIAVAILVLNGYYGYAGVTFAVALSAGINLF
jgi:hypothetical protein